ncbi:MAG TPA: hypothetical protein VKB70_01815, partial [Gaiellaceae bacterium]|nr:hypothetical protein [Gaiellaceae bacterium]
MSGGSPIDSLRKTAAVSDADAAAVFGVAGRDALLDDVMRTPVGRRRFVRRAPRSRPMLAIAFAAVAVVGVATAATWAVLGSSARETTSVDCVINGTDTIIPSISGDPAYDCAVTWRDELGTTPPALAAYDNGSGGVSVIPRSDKAQSGWTPLPAGQDVALIQLQDSLDDYIGGLNSSCLDDTTATSLARSKLTQFGFADWTISVRNPQSSSTTLPTPKAVPGTKTAPTEHTSGTKQCIASDIVDPSTKTLTLVPS